MSTFLFAAQAGMGHLNPALTLGRALRRAGHRVVFAGFGPESVLQRIRASDFPLETLPHPPTTPCYLLLPHTSGLVETALAFLLFVSSSDHIARAIEPHLEKHGVDVVVADFAYPGAWYAAERKGLPWATLYHAGLAYPGPGVPPFASGLPIGGDWGWRGRWLKTAERGADFVIQSILGGARRRLGLPPVHHGRIFWSSPWLTLVLTAEGVEAPRHPLPENSFYVGPCFDEQRQDGGDFPFDLLDAGRPVVYVSLGTVFNNKPAAFGRILEAFSDGACQVVVSAGGAFSRLQQRGVPSNVLLFERVPQIQVLSRVDAVIGHGGNNTVNETLAAGKPILAMPVGGEQSDNASRVVYQGAGLRADLGRSTPGEIRAKVNRLLGEPGFREAAERCRDALADTAGLQTACTFLERLATTRRPICRPQGYPQTVARGAPAPWEV